MKKFVLLHYGFVTPTPEIMEAWTDWHASIGDRLVEMCGPFAPGVEITRTGVNELAGGLEAMTGYSVIHADSMDAAVEIAKACPSITSVRVYEVMSMQK